MTLNARITISVPPVLKRRMETAEAEYPVNWSLVARMAFMAKLDELHGYSTESKSRAGDE